MLNGELDQRSQQDQHTAPRREDDAQDARRFRAIPIIQLSRATIVSIILALLAAVTFGAGYMQLQRWDAEATSVIEGQRALAAFIATAALAVLLALGAMVVWSASANTTGRAADNRDRIRGEAALRQRLDDIAVSQDALIAETRSAARLTWRALHVLRQLQRSSREAGSPSDRGVRSRVAAIERTLKAAAAGAFDPATQAAIHSINRELSSH